MNPDRPTAPVSVLIPCFRCAPTIARALDSVFAQSVVPAEIIVVDDGSDDETPEALRALERRHGERIRILRLAANRGAASARNAGWALATQPYLAFLDADDSWHPDKLRIQYEYMKAHPEVSLCGHGRSISRDCDAPSVPAGNPAVTRIDARGLLFSNAFSTPTVMLKSDIPLRFPEGQRHVEDAFLWQRIALSGLAVVRIESELACIHKAPYGSAGLSSELWNMERAELGNFRAHYRAGKIGPGLLLAASLYSLAKYVRRILVQSAGTTR